jgi:hypothetical protein
MSTDEPLARRRFRPADLAIVLLIIGVCLWLGISLVARSRSEARAKSCRDNLQKLATAVVEYDTRFNRLPGYMNAMKDSDDKAYVDPRTGKSSPVSWAVELLPDLQLKQLYERWRQPMGAAGENRNSDYLRTPVAVFRCPEDGRDASGPLLSYVANTGRQDLPAAIRASAHAAESLRGAAASKGMPRDWLANGVFFDTYSDDASVKLDPATRGPMVISRLQSIIDAKDKTLLFTENVDAGSYVFDPREVPDGDPALAEIGWGCIWGSGKIDETAMLAAWKIEESKRSSKVDDEHDWSGPQIFPTLIPDPPASAINAHLDESRRERSYKYCRPASHHGGGVNIAMAGRNVVFVKETISYFLYAKLLASRDEQMKKPGSAELESEWLRKFQIAERLCE